MAYQSFLISDAKTGLQLDKPSFLTAIDAFQILENAYIWRSRIRKKLGCSSLARLQRKLSNQSLGITQNPSGIFSGNIFSILSLESSSQLSPTTISVIIGSQIFTEPTILDGTLSNGIGGTGTINYSSGALTIITSPPLAATTVIITFSYYPGLPSMACLTREIPLTNNNSSVCFDKKYSYTYNNTMNQFTETPSVLPTTWSGNDSDFFWGFNAYDALFVTNRTPGLQGYNVNLFSAANAGPPPTVNITTTLPNNLSIGDQIMFIDNSGAAAANNGLRGQVTAIISTTQFTVENIDNLTWTNGIANGILIIANQNISGDGIRWYDGNTWINFNPVVNPTTAVMGCLMIIYYRDRIVLLNTIEGNSIGSQGITFPQRARWSQNGTPFQDLPVPANSQLGTTYTAWREDIAGSGGYVDAPTQENIISASFLKDTLVVFFEKSTWKLRYTNNEVLPFVWERVDSEFGSKGTFSTVFFDIGPLTISTRGSIQTDGVNVLRIDNIIPDEVFEFENQNSGPERIYGIRDYNLQLVYWAFPNDQEDGIYPNRILCYNYRNQSWAIFRDSFTCFGKWQSFADLKWENATMTWGEATFPWNDFPKQALYESTIAGNQQGYISIIQDQTSNDATLRIETISSDSTSTIILSTNNNLYVGDYVKFINIIGDYSVLNNIVYLVQPIDNNNFYIFSYNTNSLVFDVPVTSSGTYIGLGEIQRVDNFKIKTKDFNMILQEGVQTILGWIDFYTDATSAGEFSVNIYTNGNSETPVNAPSDNSTNDDLINNQSNVVTTYPNDFDQSGQTKLWHTLYNVGATGNLFSIEMTLSPEEINNFDAYSSDLTIYALNIWASKGSERLS